MNEAATGGANADLTGDSIVNNADRDEWLALAGAENGFVEPLLVGDSNLDGTVDTSDLNALALAWRQTDALNWTDGNFTAESRGVNATDLNELALNWRKSSAMAAAGQAVPEPSTLALILLAAMLGLTIRPSKPPF